MPEKVGRPTIVDEMALQKLEEAFANGATDEQACFIANISTSTFYNYQDKYPEFVERKEALKNMIKYQAKIKVKEAILNEDKPDTAKWYLEKKDKDFNPTQKIDANVTTKLSDPNDPELIKIGEQYDEEIKKKLK